MGAELVNDMVRCCAVVEVVYLPVIAKVVHCDEIVSIVQLEEVYSDLDPWLLNDWMWHQCLFLLAVCECLACVTFLNKVLNLPVHSWLDYCLPCPSQAAVYTHMGFMHSLQHALS